MNIALKVAFDSKVLISKEVDDVITLCIYADVVIV